LRFLADENIPIASVEALRGAGHDVVAVAEVAQGASDRAVLRIACDESRLLVTFDRDFGALVFGETLQVPMGLGFFCVLSQ